MEISQKWLGEGANGVLDPWSKGLPRVFCTTQTRFCTGATLSCTSARGIWRPWSKTPFAPSPNHFWEISIFGLSLPMIDWIWTKVLENILSLWPARLKNKGILCLEIPNLLKLWTVKFAPSPNHVFGDFHFLADRNLLKLRRLDSLNSIFPKR